MILKLIIMKQLLLIFFCVPFLIYSQYSLDLSQIESIYSKGTFQKVMLENGFKKRSSGDLSSLGRPNRSYITYENKTETIQANVDLWMEKVFGMDSEVLSFNFEFKDPNGKWSDFGYISDKYYARYDRPERRKEVNKEWNVYNKIVNSIKTSSEFRYIYENEKKNYEAIYYNFNSSNEDMKNMVIGYYNAPKGSYNYYEQVGVIKVVYKKK